MSEGRDQKDVRRRHPGQGKEPSFRGHLTVRFPGRLDPAKPLEVRKFIVFPQCLGGHHNSLAGLLAAIADLLRDRFRREQPRVRRATPSHARQDTGARPLRIRPLPDRIEILCHVGRTRRQNRPSCLLPFHVLRSAVRIGSASLSEWLRSALAVPIGFVAQMW